MNNDKPIMIVAMPSSGSDWLAKVVSEVLNQKYAREWFNPLCNWENADTLIDAGFACESVNCIDNLGKPAHSPTLDDLVHRFTKIDGFTMTKEIWSQGKYAQLSRHFNIVGLARKTNDTFPPSRARVLNWYQTVARNVYGLRGIEFVQSARNGYGNMLVDHLEDMTKNDIPVLWWDKLVSDSKEDLVRSFSKVDFLSDHAEALSDSVLASRKPRKR